MKFMNIILKQEFKKQYSHHTYEEVVLRMLELSVEFKT